MEQQQERNIGIISAIPAYVLSALLSRFVPDVLSVTFFTVCLVLFIALRKQYFKRKKIMFLNYALMVFCSIHFFAFCFQQIPDGTSYESPSDESAAKSMAIVLSIPCSFIFSIFSGVLFDVWKNKNVLWNKDVSV